MLSLKPNRAIIIEEKDLGIKFSNEIIQLYVNNKSKKVEHGTK